MPRQASKSWWMHLIFFRLHFGGSYLNKFVAQIALIIPVVLNKKAKYLQNFDIFFIVGQLCLS